VEWDGVGWSGAEWSGGGAGAAVLKPTTVSPSSPSGASSCSRGRRRERDTSETTAATMPLPDDVSRCSQRTLATSTAPREQQHAGCLAVGDSRSLRADRGSTNWMAGRRRGAGSCCWALRNGSPPHGDGEGGEWRWSSGLCARNEDGQQCTGSGSGQVKDPSARRSQEARMYARM